MDGVLCRCRLRSRMPSPFSIPPYKPEHENKVGIECRYADRHACRSERRYDACRHRHARMAERQSAAGDFRGITEEAQLRQAGKPRTARGRMRRGNGRELSARFAEEATFISLRSNKGAQAYVCCRAF